MFIYLCYNALFWHHLSKEKDINKKYVIIYHNNIITHQCIMYSVQFFLRLACKLQCAHYSWFLIQIYEYIINYLPHWDNKKK